MPKKVNYEPYILYWRDRLTKEKPLNQERAKLMLKLARNCAGILKNEFVVKKVYLIGSVLYSEALNKWSDIDLVVEGLGPRKYFDVFSRLVQELPDEIRLDIIPYEDANQQLKKVILEEGVLL